ncbi:chemotaxis protein CheD [Halobium salinum]|uniref:Probable chemoreceptor glutamine deamidase CheD n=1 Tax=Halobium salinum TaxID=1364940 RepID=A0ABD5PHH0_9EURY|nr:chemotaxis protein CheD [Halobium salinum]
MSESAPGAEPRLVRVGVAEYEVATGDVVLSTSGLGSCLGIALHDRSAGVGGLLHAMLPAAAEGREAHTPAKYVDTGVADLLSTMVATGAEPGRLRAKLVGGSRMLDFSDEAGRIGDRNAEAAEAALSETDVAVVARDVGGSHGRSVRLDVSSGDLHVRTVTDGESVI